MFLKIDSRTHSGVFKINAHIPLLLFVLLPPIPNYNVDDFVLRGASRRRVSDDFAAVCTQLFHVQLCDRGRGAGYNICGDLNMCLYFEDTGSEKTRVYKKQPANMTALMQMQRRYDIMFMCAHMHPCKI